MSSIAAYVDPAQDPSGRVITVTPATPLPTTDSGSSAVSTAIGAKNDPAATTDTGTFSLIALFKRLLEKFTAFSTASGTALSTSAPAAVVAPTITVSTSPAYTSGDSIGGKWTLASAVAVSGGTSLLHEIHLFDRSNQKPAGTILLFNADPTAATITDNAAFVYSTDDAKQVAAIPVASSDWTTINSKAFADLSALGREIKAASGTTLYAAFVTTSTPTFAATTDFLATFKFLPVNS